MKKKGILQNQYIYSVFTKLIVVGIGFLNSMLLARYLGPELKGMAAATLNYANIISIIITFGLHEAYPFFRKKRESKDFLSEYMTMVITIYVVYALIISGILFFVKPQAEVIACVIVTLLMGYSMIVNYVALVESPNHRNTVMTWIYVIDLLVLAALYIFVPASYMIAVFLTAFVYLAQTVYYTFDLKFSFNVKLLSWADFKEYVKFGFFPMVALLLTTLNYRVDVIMLRAAPQISYAEIGVYSVGVSLAEKVFLIPNAVKEILLSKLANGKSGEEVCKTIRMCWPICLLSTVGILMLGKPFINLFYGGEYSGAYWTTIICVFGTVFMIFFKMISTYNIVNGHQKINLMLLAVSDAVNIGLNAILIPYFGTNGAAFASDVSYFICAALFVTYFCKSQRIKFRDVVFLKKDDINALKRGKKQ